MQSKKLKVLAAAVVLALPVVAQAESNIDDTGPTYSASARVNFRVEIPGFVFLQVGTGTALANNGTIDELAFAPTIAQLGTGTPISGTGGNAGPSGLLVDVRGNVGTLSLSVAETDPLNSGANVIPWSQIQATAAGSAPTPPTVGGSPTSIPGPAVSAQGQWNYQYLNGATPPAGTYTGQLQYTLALP